MITNPFSDILQEPSPGTLELGGARMAFLDIEAGFWGIRRQIEALIGNNLTRSVLQQAGANGGASFARSFADHKDLEIGQALAACIKAYQVAGFGQFEILSTEWPLGRVQIRGRDAFEAWMYRRHQLAAEDPVCAYSAGVFVGFINILGDHQDVVCIEHACQAKGDEACLFELLPAEEAEGGIVVPYRPDPGLGRQINLLEMLFERMPMGIAVLDLEYRIQRYNPTWVDFSRQYAPEDTAPLVPGVSYFEHLPGTEPVVLPLFERALSGETVQQNGVGLESGSIETYWDVVLAPLVEDGKVVGILNVAVDATERVALQQNLEKRVSARTHELNRRREIAESLRDIIAVLNSSQSLEETLAYITKRASEVMNAQACLIHHVRAEKEFVAIEASYGLPDSLSAIPGFPLFSSPSADERILNREPVWISDFDHLPIPSEEELAALPADVRTWRDLTQQHYRAWLAVPLLVGDEVYGSLAFYFSTSKSFDDEEKNLSQGFADQAALAIQNAGLFEKAEGVAIAAERNRLARDLHDAVTQTLFSASMIADVLPKIWEKNPEEGLRRLGELRQLTRGALSEMRTLLVELRPAALVDTDLEDLIGHQVNAFIARTRLPVTFHCNCLHKPPPEIKETFYRIVQEAFNNINKHADASAVQVKLDCQSRKAFLEIGDDGIGFDVDAARKEGLGLGIMEERVRNCGGQLTIQSQIGMGTKIKISWVEPSKE